MIPLDQICLFKLGSTRTSEVPMVFWAKALMALMAWGARFLKDLIWGEKSKGVRNESTLKGRLHASISVLFLRVGRVANDIYLPWTCLCK